MADTKISADTTVTPGGSDFFPIVQGGANRKSTIASLPISTATQASLDAKLDDSQLDVDGTLSANSDSKIASQKATKTYVDTAVASATIPDATTSIKGKVKLAGDLWGTADLPTVPGLSGKQATLVSGTNIKTINGTSILGSGDVVISGTGTVTNVSSANARATISNPTTTPIITIVSAPIADTVTTNANLTGDVTSVGNATTLSNTAVSAWSYTNTNITVDSKGRITSASNGSSWAGDVVGPASAVNNNFASFNTTTGKLIKDSGSKASDFTAANVAITGATKTKVTYDSKGLVTAGADATTADIADSTNKRYVTDAYLTVIGNTSGTNSGNQTIANTSDWTSHTATLSATGGSIKFVEGANITLTTTGTGADGIVTIASTASGSGDVVWPASSVDNTVARYNLTTGKLIQWSWVVISDTNDISWVGNLDIGWQLTVAVNSSDAIISNWGLTFGGSSFRQINDWGSNELIKFPSTSVASAVNEFTITNAATGTWPTISATWNDTNIDFNVVTKWTGTFKVNGSSLWTGDMVLASTQTNSGLKTFLDGTLWLRNIANTFTSLFTNTNTAARTYTLKDSNGTIAFTSDITGTNSGTNTGDVTLSGTPNYITIAGQVITRALIDLTTHVTGLLPFANIANVATGTVMYRKTAATGAMEAQTLATLKTDLGLTGTNSGDQTITLTGDVTGTGTGSFASTLATVNSNVGTFGSATQVAVPTVNAKGLITAISNSPIQIAESQVTNLTTDLAAKQNTISLTTTGTSGAATLVGSTLNIPQYTGGVGDMVLASTQTNSGLKTFLNGTLGLRNIANTFTSLFSNANTAARTYTLKDSDGTLAFTSDITGTNSGTNTGDQTITLTGDVTGSGTGSFAATLANTAVSAGSYTSANITVDSKGRITSAANGSGWWWGAGIAQQQSITSSGQTVFNLSYSYTIGDKGMSVYVNGMRQTIGTHYTETGTSQITFTSTVTSWNVVDFVYLVGVGAAWTAGLATGTATLNFGSTPWTNFVTTTITGQTSILSTSKIRAYLMASSTATHNAYEHSILPITLTCGNVVAGVGFDIYASSTLRLDGTFSVVWEYII